MTNGDKEALRIINWAGDELGKMVITVAKQLYKKDEVFKVIQIGGLFTTGEIIKRQMHKCVLNYFPQAKFISPKLAPEFAAARMAKIRTD